MEIKMFPDITGRDVLMCCWKCDQCLPAISNLLDVVENINHVSQPPWVLLYLGSQVNARHGNNL